MAVSEQTCPKKPHSDCVTFLLWHTLLFFFKPSHRVRSYQRLTLSAFDLLRKQSGGVVSRVLEAGRHKKQSKVVWRPCTAPKKNKMGEEFSEDQFTIWQHILSGMLVPTRPLSFHKHSLLFVYMCLEQFFTVVLWIPTVCTLIRSNQLR
jgi:hypothetical protein